MKISSIFWTIIAIVVVFLLLWMNTSYTSIAILVLSTIGVIASLKWMIRLFSDSSDAADDIEQILTVMTEQQNALSREYLAHFLRDD